MAGTILTEKGRQLLAKALTGKTLLFTKAAAGNGDLGSLDPYGLNALVSQKLELPITAMNTSSVGTAEIICELSNESLTTGFFLKEYGLFAKDPDDGTEILYCYANKGDKSGYLEGYDGTNPIHHTLHIITVIDQAASVTANITASYSYVTKSALDSRIASLFASPGDTAGFFTFINDDEHVLRPLPLSDTKRLIIGAADIDSLIHRVETLEDAVSSHSLRLDFLDDYSSPDCFMAEDFADPDTVDMFTARITSIITGDDSIDCDPEEGLLPGSWYTITDGSQHEDVQVESVSLENGIARVILYDTVKNTYNLPSCRIVRTTADIHAGEAYGSAMTRPLTWIPSTDWKGLADNAEYSISLSSTVSSSNSFTFTGNASISADGSLTLGR